MTKHATQDHELTGSDAAVSSGVRAAQSERRRADILKASADVLTQGYADFSLRKVAAAAGVRLNTVQHHFGDLESLVLATVESMLGEFPVRIRQLAAGQFDSPSDDLMVFLDEAWVAIRDTNVRTFFIELWAMGLHRPSIGQLVRQLYAEYWGCVAAIVHRVNPSLTEAEVHTLAMLICSWTEGAMVMAHWSGPGTPSLSFVGLRMKAACIALVGTPANAGQREPQRRPARHD
jgi:AcrR family transcriptional regulator